MPQRHFAFSLLLNYLYFLTLVKGLVKPDFYFYPQAARPCMDQAGSAAGCDAIDTHALNDCLCGNGGNFITNTAACLGKSARGELQRVYSLMSGACAKTSTPMKLHQKEFMNIANEANLVPVPVPAPPPPPPQPTLSVVSKAITADSTVIIPTTTLSTISHNSISATTTELASTTTYNENAPITITTKSAGGKQDASSNIISEDTNHEQGGLSKAATAAIIIVLFLVGAIIGLLIWLYKRRKRQTCPEEYGPKVPPKTKVYEADSLPSNYIPTTSKYDYKTLLARKKTKSSTDGEDESILIGLGLDLCEEKSISQSSSRHQYGTETSLPSVAELPTPDDFAPERQPGDIFEMDSMAPPPPPRIRH